MSAIRILVWAVHVALPAIGLWVLVANPHLDHEYMHQGVHFWLILGAALLSLALGVLLLRAARTHRDMRLILVSLVFQLNAGFLALHALATPGVILPSANVGFTTAVPVGMVLGGFAALASAVEYGPTARIHKYTGVLAALPITVMSAWALLSLTRVPPFDAVPDPSEVQGPLEAAAFLGAACYVAAAIRYAYLYLRNRGTVVLSVLTAFLLLAEALFAVGFGRSWRVSWWEWHVLLGLAFALIAVSAHRTFRKEGSVRGLFDSVTLRSTVAAMERDYASALEEMMTALSQRAAGGVPADEPLGAVGQRLSRRFGLTERQLAVLQQSARALGNEREQVRRLGALVAVGERASVIRGERQLVTEIQRLAGYAFEHDTVRIGMLSGGRLIFEDGGHPNPAAFAFPLTVKGIHTGVLELTRANGSGTAGSGTTGTTTSVGATAVPHPPAGSANRAAQQQPGPRPGWSSAGAQAASPTLPEREAKAAEPPPGPVTAAHRSLGVDGPREGPALPTAPARTVPAPGVAPGPENSPGLGTARPVPGPGGGRARRGFGWRPATSAEEGGSGFHTERPPAGPEGGASVLAVYHEYGAAGLGPAEQAVARSFAAQTSVVLENARLYQQLDGLFRSYMSPAVATALLADPSQAGLGGEVHEVSVLMADLRGYTPFAEKAGPVQVMRMLNTYYGAIVPEILAEGGTVVQFVGDAVMAIFNAPVRQWDHAVRAARAGLALQRATAAVRERAGAHGVEWPMFRVGVNTGPAIVGNVGAREMRNFTAIGDTTNLAARLEGLAEPGTVVVGPVTRERLGTRADTECLGDFDIKGKSLPVTVYRLVALR